MTQFCNLLLLTFLLLCTTQTANASSDIPHILILNSYDESDEWETAIMDSFSDTFSLDATIDTLYLDLESEEVADNQQKTLARLTEMYANKQLDLIISVDDLAFDLMRPEILNETSLFFETPLAFIGCNESTILTDKEKQYMTGIIDDYNTPTLIETIKAMQPLANEIETLHLIFDETPYSQKQRTALLNTTHSIPFELNIIEHTYFEDVQLALESIDTNNSAVIVSGIFKNQETDSYVLPSTVVQTLTEQLAVPILSDRQAYFETDVMGGYYDDGFIAGQLLASLTEEILTQDDIRLIPVRREPLASFTFDYKQLRAHDFNFSHISPQTVLTNQSFMYVLTSNPIFLILAVTIALIGGITLRFKYRNKKRNV